MHSSDDMDQEITRLVVEVIERAFRDQVSAVRCAIRLHETKEDFDAWIWPFVESHCALTVEKLMPIARCRLRCRGGDRRGEECLRDTVEMFVDGFGTELFKRTNKGDAYPDTELAACNSVPIEYASERAETFLDLVDFSLKPSPFCELHGRRKCAKCSKGEYRKCDPAENLLLNNWANTRHDG